LYFHIILIKNKYSENHKSCMTAFNEVKWKDIAISSSAAYGTCSLKIGTLGKGTPCATIIAGVHGDEGPWGALVIKYMLDSIESNEIIGSLKIVPVANPLAMESDSRVSPLDDLDLNRVFPGDPNGSHTYRLAAAIVEHSLIGADYVYDLHGGGSWCVNAFGFSFSGSEDMVTAINPPFIVDTPEKQGTLSGYSRKKGSKVSAIEMGGRCSRENDWAERTADGLKASLIDLGVISGEKPQRTDPPARKVGPTTVLRSDEGGIFIPGIREDVVGTVIKKGTTLGKIVDPVTMDDLQEFVAPFEETAVLLLRTHISVVEGGAMIYVLAPLKEEVDS
jgi:predicted deacylase